MPIYISVLSILGLSVVIYVFVSLLFYIFTFSSSNSERLLKIILRLACFIVVMFMSTQTFSPDVSISNDEQVSVIRVLFPSAIESGIDLWVWVGAFTAFLSFVASTAFFKRMENPQAIKNQDTISLYQSFIVNRAIVIQRLIPLVSLFGAWKIHNLMQTSDTNIPIIQVALYCFFWSIVLFSILYLIQFIYVWLLNYRLEKNLFARNPYEAKMYIDFLSKLDDDDFFDSDGNPRQLFDKPRRKAERKFSMRGALGEKL